MDDGRSGTRLVDAGRGGTRLVDAGRGARWELACIGLFYHLNPNKVNLVNEVYINRH